MMVADAEHLAMLQDRLGPSARRDEPLSRHTSIRIGGPADLFYVARSSDDLRRAVEEAHRAGVPWRVIGGGSNVLIADAGVSGLVVKATAPNAPFRVTESGAGLLVEAQAGDMLAALGRRTVLRGLSGLEWAVNVPGTVGAAVVNNSGAFGSCVAEHLVCAVLYIPGEGTCTVNAEELEYTYRDSALKRGEPVAVVLTAVFRVGSGSRADLQQCIAEIQRTRRATQPPGFSLGSIFTNPTDDAAGRLIEQAGLKGSRIGDAEVSPIHANFILNRGRASAQDVIDLMHSIQAEVWRTTRVWLTPEIQFLGRFASDPTLILRTPKEPDR